ncbi:MAG: hypothetical protein IPK13_00115 [Deltaproteobacteria bacterium]|nr:hypothetical protein [Deltaproteobacteria bacterium]
MGPNDRFWVVTDPTRDSTLADILFETTLAGLFRQIRGGLSNEQRPTIFTAEVEARAEATKRIAPIAGLD